MSNKAEILELEGPLSGGLAAVLPAEGLETTVATSLQELLPLVGEETRLIILDVLAPGVTREAWQTLQGTYRGPVLLIAPALGKLEGEVVTTPFELEHLLRQVRELLKEAPLDVVKVGHLAIDVNHWRVTRRGRPVPLSRLEFHLLAYLARRLGEVVTYEELLVEVWDYPAGEGDEKLVTRCIHRLRQKLEDDPSHPEYLVNVRGVGYCLTIPKE